MQIHMVSEILQKYPKSKDYLLEILHEVQNTSPNQHISSENIVEIAHHLNITLAQVQGVIGYYSMLSSKVRGKHLIRVCNSPVCNMLGSEHTIEYISKKLKVRLGESTPDGLFTIEECECLGNCAAAPSIMINDKLYGNLTSELIDKILDDLK